MAQGQRTIPNSKPTGFAKFGPVGSVDEARAKMLASKETFVSKTGRTITPTFKGVEGANEAERIAADAVAAQDAETRHEAEVVPSRGTGGNTPVQQTERQPAVPSQSTVTAEEIPAAVERQPAEIEDDERERVETAQFVGEIYREDNEWVAELSYKNGAGNERFTAPTQKALLKKMLEGKGYATIKVREEVRRRKLGNQLDTFDSAIVPAIKTLHNLSEEQFYALPETVQTSIIASIQVPELSAFMQEYPEFYNVQSNWDLINQWLIKTNSPATRRNVGLAFTDLTEDGILTAKPSTKQVPQAPVSTGPAAVVSVAAPAAAAEDSVVAPTAAPRKRGQSGLIPGQSSAAPVTAPAAASEEGTQPRQLSRKESKAMDIKALRREAIPSLSRLSGPPQR